MPELDEHKYYDLAIDVSGVCVTQNNVRETVTFGDVFKDISQFNMFKEVTKSGTAVVINNKSYFYAKVAKEAIGDSKFKLRDVSRGISNRIVVVDRFKGG